MKFKMAEGNYNDITDLYKLVIVDYFVEDHYPEIYKVVGFIYEFGKDENYSVRGEEIISKDVCSFFHSNTTSVYGPHIIKLELVEEQNE
jgi:hypothetical protein